MLAFAKDRTVSLQKFLEANDPLSNFNLPMTRQAHNEFLLLLDSALEMRSEQTELNDEWSYIWGGGRYSASKFYRHSFIAVITPKPLKWIWKSKCVPKIKFFSWFLLKDKLNTRNMLRRRRKFLEEGYSCPVCLLDVEETRDHLFFGCSYARERWRILNINFNGNLGIYQRIKSAKRCFT